MFALGSLMALALFATISLLKTYQHVPLKELRRQARQGDHLAQVFYRVANHDRNTRLLLWLLVGLLASGFFMFLYTHLVWWLAFIIGTLVTWFGFAWLPGSHISRPGVWLARQLAGPLAWLLERLYGPLHRSSDAVARLRPVTVHSGLYTRSDLKDLLKQQGKQLDNRIAQHDLDSVLYALTMRDKSLGSIMTPLRKAKTLSAADTIGPIMLDELHATGHTHFPVYQDDKKHIIGVVGLSDLIKAKTGGSIKSAMRGLVYYLHEEDSLGEALAILGKTKQPLFVVVNSNEAIVGVVSLTDLLSSAQGQLPSDDFNDHESLASVAAKQKRKHEQAKAELAAAKAEAPASPAKPEPPQESEPSETETKPAE